MISLISSFNSFNSSKPASISSTPQEHSFGANKRTKMIPYKRQKHVNPLGIRDRSKTGKTGKIRPKSTTTKIKDINKKQRKNIKPDNLQKIQESEMTSYATDIVNKVIQQPPVPYIKLILNTQDFQITNHFDQKTANIKSVSTFMNEYLIKELNKKGYQLSKVVWNKDRSHAFHHNSSTAQIQDYDVFKILKLCGTQSDNRTIQKIAIYLELRPEQPKSVYRHT